MTTPPGPGGPYDPQSSYPPPPPGGSSSYPGYGVGQSGGGSSYPPAGGYPAPPGGAPQSNGLAIGALITSIIAVLGGCFCLGAPLGPVAVVLGFMGKRKADTSGGRVGGRGMAITGIVLGVIATLMLIAWIVLFAYIGSLDPAEVERWLEEQGVETTTS